MPTKKQSFEEGMTELETIVQKLEQGDVSLEDAIALYEKGMQLSKNCHEQLQKAEKQLVQVVGKDGKEQPFDTDGEI